MVFKKKLHYRYHLRADLRILRKLQSHFEVRIIVVKREKLKLREIGVLISNFLNVTEMQSNLQNRNILTE